MRMQNCIEQSTYETPLREPSAGTVGAASSLGPTAQPTTIQRFQRR